jgi:hypothetical protein
VPIVLGIRLQANNATACSESFVIINLDRYNMIMEKNRVYNNVIAGIMITRNTHDSILRNNINLNENTVFPFQNRMIMEFTITLCWTSKMVLM